MLSETPKYRFIIEQIALERADAHLLEIGCSRGHLTSYFILQNRDIVGVDASPNAVSAAVAAFGEYFVTVGDSRIKERAPYDVIYHVGTIGCVADPIRMTHELLGMLKPGGRLLFNAPNLDACSLPDQLWLSAPPPDLVTIYRPGFWQKYFQNVAHVVEQIEYRPPSENLVMQMRKFGRRRWRPSQPIDLGDESQGAAGLTSWDEIGWHNLERITRRFGVWTRMDRLARAHPAEYGLFVSMTKR
jgi:SAM-dependent methyltransferase